MKTRRLVAALVLLISLLAGSISATAGDKLSSINTALGNNTISGYVNSSADWEPQATVSGRHSGWWWDFMLWLGFRGR
jgi:hypothetical protein